MRHDFEKSSNLKSADLDAGVCTVTFLNGTTVRYGGFTDELFAEWLKAASAGRWFHARVRLHPELHPIVGALDAKATEQAVAIADVDAPTDETPAPTSTPPVVAPPPPPPPPAPPPPAAPEPESAPTPLVDRSVEPVTIAGFARPIAPRSRADIQRDQRARARARRTGGK